MDGETDMRELKMHYAGGIIAEDHSSLRGWAACCSGDRCMEIDARGNVTYDQKLVTCKSCLAQIKKHNDFAPRYAEIRKKHGY